MTLLSMHWHVIITSTYLWILINCILWSIAFLYWREMRHNSQFSSRDKWSCSWLILDIFVLLQEMKKMNINHYILLSIDSQLRDIDIDIKFTYIRLIIFYYVLIMKRNELFVITPTIIKEIIVNDPYRCSFVVLD